MKGPGFGIVKSSVNNWCLVLAFCWYRKQVIDPESKNISSSFVGGNPENSVRTTFTGLWLKENPDLKISYIHFLSG